MRLRHGPVEIGLLLGDGVFGALDLVGAAGIGAALVEGGQLALQTAANHIGSLRIGARLVRCRLVLHGCRRRLRRLLRGGGAAERQEAEHRENRALRAGLDRSVAGALQL